MQPADILKHSPLFTGLDRKTLKEIGEALLIERFSVDCDIRPPPQAARRFYIITRGRVKITRLNGQNGRELTLWLLGPGDCFDTVTLLDGAPHAVVARTLDAVEALSAPVAVAQEWLEKYPPFRLAVHRYVAKQLRELTELAGGLALDDTMTRLAHLLLRHFATGADAPPASANLITDLSHDELAAMIGSVRVVVNRLLARLKRETVVELHNGRLGIVNLKRLLRYAETHLEGRRKMHREKSSKT